MREEGFYWVKTIHCDEWIVCEWIQGSDYGLWFPTIHREGVPDSRLAVIGPRILPPTGDEQCENKASTGSV